MKRVSERAVPAVTLPRIPLGPDPELHTPLLPAQPLRVGQLRGLLTVMSGLDAGRVATIEGAAIVVGRDPEADLWTEDPAVSRRHARFGHDPEGHVYVQDLESTNGTFLHDRRVSIARLEPGDYVQLGGALLVRFEFTDATDEALRRQLYESSVLDPLTRAYNRRYLAQRLGAEVAHALRTGAPLAALMLDLDHFKDFNDRHGHLAGDRALRFVAAQVMRLIRAGDLLARYGGEEFVVVSRSAGDEALLLAERLRSTVASMGFSVAGASTPVSVSIGVASLSELTAGEDPSALVRRADERLYQAKLGGRNRVCGP